MSCQTAESFTVLSYNIRYGKGQDGVQNLNRIATVLSTAQAQLIGLQEVDKHHLTRSKNVDQSKFLAEQLGMDYHFAPALVKKYQFGNSILTNLPIQKKDQLLLKKKGTCEDRSLAVAEVLIADQPLTFLSTHLGLAQGERLEHIELILDYIKDSKNPVVLVGDWNEQPGSPAYNRISEVLQDAALVTKQEQPTFPYLALYEKQANVRIDFIFVSSELEVIDVEVIQNWASDHLPVKAILQLKRKEAS